MAVYLGSNWVGETRAIYSDTGESLNDFIENGISGAYENSEVTNIRSYAFQYCTALTTISFPNATNIGTNAFYNCNTLTVVNCPKVTNIGSNAFGSCYSLNTASFPKVTSIESNAFRSCRRLLSLYLLGSSIPTLASTNVFYSTPISNYTTSTGGVYGSIYVPASLYNSYITATNWVTYSSRFASVYGTITWGFVSADGQRYARIRDNNGNIKTGIITIVAGGTLYSYQDGSNICDEATWDALSPDYGYSYSATFNNGTTSHSLTMTRSDYDDPFVGYLLI